MKKIIIRNEPIPHLMSNFIFFNGDKKFASKKEFFDYYGIDKILKEVFNEDEKFSILVEKYNECVATELNNNYFFIAYLIDADYGLTISNNSSHIYLIRLEPCINLGNKSIFDWHYYSNKKYIGDAWWSNDEEIIEDICKMSMISFLKKYKGF